MCERHQGKRNGKEGGRKKKRGGRDRQIEGDVRKRKGRKAEGKERGIKKERKDDFLWFLFFSDRRTICRRKAIYVCPVCKL